MKITIFGDEGVPVQVDGEAWVQPPGIIKIVHKNRAQMLTRDRVCNSLFMVTFHRVHTLCGAFCVRVQCLHKPGGDIAPRWSWSDCEPSDVSVVSSARVVHALHHGAIFLSFIFFENFVNSFLKVESYKKSRKH